MTDAKKKRKGLLRKPAVQVELALPPPPGPGRFRNTSRIFWGGNASQVLKIYQTGAAKV